VNPIEPQLPVHAGAKLQQIAETQDEYQTLPAYVDAAGLVLTEWEPTAAELHQLLTGGRIRIWIHTFGQDLQPLSVEAIGGEPPKDEHESVLNKWNL
jgi:hypothetical protein